MRGHRYVTTHAKVKGREQTCRTTSCGIFISFFWLILLSACVRFRVLINCNVLLERGIDPSALSLPGNSHGRPPSRRGSASRIWLLPIVDISYPASHLSGGGALDSGVHTSDRVHRRKKPLIRLPPTHPTPQNSAQNGTSFIDSSMPQLATTHNFDNKKSRPTHHNRPRYTNRFPGPTFPKSRLPAGWMTQTASISPS